MTTHLPDPAPPQPGPVPLVAPPAPLPDAPEDGGTAQAGGTARDRTAGPPAPGTPGAAGPADGPRGLRGLPARLWRGRPEDPAWARPALLALLAATAALYVENLSASGWANAFYSAAVQAGSVSWKAFFFGSSDASNFITVDKPPLALWPMALSARLLGLSSFSVLLPQALMGVAAVGTVYASVRRTSSPRAGLLAGAVLALTPVAALMFRFNNPDALLVLLLALAAYAVQRAQEAASTRWLVLAGVLLGLAFLTKTLQAFLVLPAFALVYLATAPTGWWRRVRQLLLAGAAMTAAGGWWVAVVELLPASSRPYVGGSQDDSFLSLTFGYNGFGRLTGNETGSVGGGFRGGDLPGAPGGRGGMWGSTGVTRLFDGDIGGQIAWLVPAALLLLALGLWAGRRAPRTDTARAGLLVWGGWLLCTGLTFSYMGGIFHQYYTVALAPAVAALVGMGADAAWRERDRTVPALALAAASAVTGWWAYVLLGRSADFVPWLRYAVLAVGLAGAAALLGPVVARAVRPGAARAAARAATAGAVAAVAAGVAGPAAYSLDTVSTGHSGSIVTAGPAVSGGMGGPGGRRGRGGFPGFPGGAAPQGAGGFGGLRGGAGAGQGGTGGPGPGGLPALPGAEQNGRGGLPALPGGGQAGQGGTGQGGTGQGVTGQGRNGLPSFPGMPGLPGGAGPGGVRGGGVRGGMGGLLEGARVGTAVTALLRQDASRYTWAAAAVGSQNAAGYQLASRQPVMAVGGFNGSDPAPGLAQFQEFVRQGRIHWFVAGGVGGGGGMGGSSDSSRIASWVEASFTARTVDGTTLYDLTQPKG
ncbi:glycosyltransferase family 39 protein [Streptomyces sp. NPDC001380]|uniref:glycosyltransferase family 39 protein n=1 Tax=Streptomyces sp. NPDC001380 TaxID=3364566 RepID=UPI0036BA384F